MHGKMGQTYDTIYTKKNCWCILQEKSDEDGSWMTSVAYIILFLWDHWIMMLRKGGIVHRSFWWPHAHTHKSRGLIEVDTKPRTFSSSLMYGRRCLSAHTEREEEKSFYLMLLLAAAASHSKTSHACKWSQRPWPPPPGLFFNDIKIVFNAKKLISPALYAKGGK